MITFVTVQDVLAAFAVDVISKDEARSILGFGVNPPTTSSAPVSILPAPPTSAPEGVMVSPGGDAQTVPEEPAQATDPPAPEPTTLGGEVVS